MNERIDLKAPASHVAEPKDDTKDQPHPDCCTAPPDGDGGPIKP
jgi:hypothetical protein